ncbi:tyrosine-type recombinase/integrase [Roseisolibacter agri]|uniref:Tyr recombinase domain-containing protein n=1 Tax=Roseisolibacter agri TaxID=2014610 RepID=A0AA37V6G5_9BACT|nr:tyrosine-type recombinase/integrase [Roseisolibacter agri]GLC25286.1 hypothetical protein rosag_17990 [Roseisolibacter agri]
MSLFLPAMQPSPDGMWEVEMVRLDHGERLPVIRNSRTWLPAPLALRYVLSQRPRLRPGSLANDVRGVCALYNWAAQERTVGFLDDWLARGRAPTNHELKQINRFLRNAPEEADSQQGTPVVGAVPEERGALGEAPVVDRAGEVPATTYHRRLTSVLHFLDWALRADNAGATQAIDDDEHVRIVWRVQRLFREWAAERPIPESLTPDPLTLLDIHFVRRALGADEFGRWHYADVFVPETRLRNWAMFEVAINYGLRRAELLLLRLDDLPDDDDPLRNIRVARRREVKVDKGLSRKTPRIVRVPALDPERYDVVRQYLTHGGTEGGRCGPADAETRLFLRHPSEVKRPSARPAEAPSPFEPISGARFGQTITRIGELAWHAAEREIAAGAGVVTIRTGGTATAVKVTDRVLEELRTRLTGLHPHVLRHTWATHFALAHYGEHGFDGVVHLLQLYGGWADDKMPKHYAEKAMEELGQRAAAERLMALSTNR